MNSCIHVLVPVCMHASLSLSLSLSLALALSHSLTLTRPPTPPVLSLMHALQAAYA
jgi:hypothetical protein